MSTSILSLIEAKTALLYPNPTQPSNDDTALGWFIDAAADVARYHCGDIDVALYSERYSGGNLSIFLRHLPVVSVESVEEGWGYINYELDYVEVNSPGPFSMFAYSLDNPETGQVTRRSAGNVNIPFMRGENNIYVQYRAGEQNTPPGVKMAVIQLVQHFWQQSMLRAMAQSNSFTAFDAAMGAGYSREPDSEPIDFGVPFRIVQLLRSHSRMPIIA
jgi:hypothetical protein